MEWLVWSHLAESQKLLLPSQPITNRVKTIRLDQNPSLKIKNFKGSYHTDRFPLCVGF